MSGLFKKILGQDVVHPQKVKAAAEGNATEPSVVAQPTGTKAATAPSRGRNTATPARTLLTRLQNCVVLQDMRDTLRELQNCDDLIIALTPEDLKNDIMPLLERFDEDEDVVNTVMKLLSRLTASYDDEPCVEDLDEHARRAIRAGFLEILIPLVPLLVAQLKRTHVHFFWSRFYATQILSHLEEQDPAATNKQLLECHGLGTLVDVLSDTSKDGLLRNEALRLLATLTATDAEMQTILAFENGFDSLFDLVHKLGDVESGAQGTVVIECLTIIHNLLRANKPAGKLFREMGSAQHLRPLLDIVATRLRDTQQRREQARRAGSGGRASSPTTSASPTLAAPTDYEAFTATQSTIILTAVSILGCLVRQADAGADAEEARRSALECGVLRPLVCVAMSGCAVDDATRIESLRTVTLFVRGSKTKRLTEEVLDQPVLSLVGASGTRRGLLSAAIPTPVDAAEDCDIVRWPSVRGLAEYLLCSEDKTMVAASTQLTAALLENNSASSGTMRVTESLMDGFFESCTANAASQEARSRCGFLLAQALLGGAPQTHSASPAHHRVSTPSALAPYYAAHVLRRLVQQPDGDSVVCQPTFHGAPSAEGTLPRLNPTLYLTPAVPPTLLNALMCFYISSLQQHHRQAGVDTGRDGAGTVDLHTLSAFTQLLLTFLVEYAPAVMTVLSEPQWLTLLLHEAGQADAPAHSRLWCTALLGQICLSTPTEPRPLPTLKRGGAAPAAPSRAMVLQRIRDALGEPGLLFDSLFFDVRGSGTDFSQPATDAFTGNQRVLYDEAFVHTLDAISGAMKRLAQSTPAPHPLTDGRAPARPTASPAASPPSPPALPRPDGSQGSATVGPQDGHSDDRTGLVQQLDRLSATEAPHPSPQSRPLNAAERAALQQEYDQQAQSLREECEARIRAVQEDAERQLEACRREAASERETSTARVAELEAQLQQQARELEACREEVNDLRTGSDTLEEQLRSWQQHTTRLEAAHQATLAELQRLQGAQSHENGRSEIDEATESLRRTVEELEDALARKDNEHRQQFDEARASTEAQLAAAHERVRQLEDENSALRSAPQPAAAPDTSLVELLAQQDSELQQLRQHVERLECDVHALRRDRDDLLLLVGEVDVECASLRANSANPTPYRGFSAPAEQHQSPTLATEDSHRTPEAWGVPPPAAAAPYAPPQQCQDERRYEDEQQYQDEQPPSVIQQAPANVFASPQPVVAVDEPSHELFPQYSSPGEPSRVAASEDGAWGSARLHPSEEAAPPAAPSAAADVLSAFANPPSTALAPGEGGDGIARPDAFTGADEGVCSGPSEVSGPPEIPTGEPTRDVNAPPPPPQAPQVVPEADFSSSDWVGGPSSEERRPSNPFVSQPHTGAPDAFWSAPEPATALPPPPHPEGRPNPFVSQEAPTADAFGVAEDDPFGLSAPAVTVPPPSSTSNPFAAQSPPPSVSRLPEAQPPQASSSGHPVAAAVPSATFTSGPGRHEEVPGVEPHGQNPFAQQQDMSWMDLR